MCYFKTAILTKDQTFHLELSDSHEDIIEAFNLQDDPEKIVRVEYIPCFHLDLSSWDNWYLKVEQDILPKWFDREQAEARMRRLVKDLILRDQNISSVCGKTVIACGRTVIDKAVWSRIFAFDESYIKAIGSSTVKAYGKSHITACYDPLWIFHDETIPPEVLAYNEAEVELLGSARARIYQKATARAYENSYIEAYDDSKVKAFGQAHVEVYNNAKVEAFGSSVVKVFGPKVKVQLHDKAKKV